MKHIIIGAILGLGFAGMAMADPVHGTWKTTPDDNGNFGHIQVKACDDKICGTLVRSFDADGTETQSDNIGKNIIWDMVARGDGRYSGGKIWAPDRDRTYRSRMALNGNELEVKGCVVGGLICRGQDWSRVN